MYVTLPYVGLGSHLFHGRHAKIHEDQIRMTHYPPKFLLWTNFTLNKFYSGQILFLASSCLKNFCSEQIVLRELSTLIKFYLEHFLLWINSSQSTFFSKRVLLGAFSSLSKSVLNILVFKHILLWTNSTQSIFYSEQLLLIAFSSSKNFHSGKIFYSVPILLWTIFPSSVGYGLGKRSNLDRK